MSPESRSDLVRQILENLLSPERLDAHPWTGSLFVQAAVAEDGTLKDKSPGQRLAFAVSRLFREFMPGSPPRRGKRLDTRWGEFGILASQYFAPFLFGAPSPASLRDAWGRIDQAVRSFLDGDLPEREAARYRLVSDELEVAPNSTISDWHRKGIERFTRLLLEREKHLSLSLSQPSALLDPDAPPARPDGDPRTRSRPAPAIRWTAFAALLMLAVLAGIKTWKVYRLAAEVRGDTDQLQALVSGSPGLDQLDQAGPLLDEFSQDVSALRAEASPALRIIGPALGWLPLYGPDLAASSGLLEMADHAAASARASYIGAGPVLRRLRSGSDPLDPLELTQALIEARPDLLQARRELDQALAARSGIEFGKLSPQTQALLEPLDPLLSLMDDSLAMALALPQLLGAGEGGPKTYMLLVQNEDELRSTGGFITSFGSFVVKDGQVLSVRFEDSTSIEDWTKAYPSAPWQMAQYMDIPVMLVRDANWFTDYPTSASMAEFLYAFTSNHSVDGVIAMDQQALIYLLRAMGPVTVEGVPDPISADNVVAFMREAKIPPDGTKLAEWDRKAFIGNMAAAILERLLSGASLDWELIARTVVQALDERHILLQFDDPVVTEVISRRRWDGAVRAGPGDFLMVVDSNVGYSKTNAVMEQTITYEINLAGDPYPTGSLTVSHENRAPGGALCGQAAKNVFLPDYWYPIDRCYVDYLRVYVHAEARLLEAAPHAIPAGWMVRNRAVPARVDLLDEEITGVRGYGTLLVVQGGQTLATGFRFALPAGIIATDPETGERTYSLKVQKQPGTRAVPVSLRIHLPPGAQVVETSPGALVEAGDVYLETDLRTDVFVTVVYTLP
ncbi:MAG: DUF4012 domain-containing protein [Chloroflexota bacterium]